MIFTDNEDRDAVLLRSMIELGHNLECVVTAEGVEDTQVLDMLREYGVVTMCRASGCASQQQQRVL